jgi:hypothetical protein
MAKPAADQKNKHKPKPKPVQVYTKEKARHLVHVYSAILCGMLLIGWLNIFLVNPLKNDRKEMVSHFLTSFPGCAFSSHLQLTSIPYLGSHGSQRDQSGSLFDSTVD